MKSFMLVLTGIALLTAAGVASAGEIQVGKVKVVYNASGKMTIYYNGVEVARRPYVYLTLLGPGKKREACYSFPSSARRFTLSAVEDAKDKDGEPVGKQVTWTIKPDAFAPLAKDKASFIRVIVTESAIRMEIETASSVPADKFGRKKSYGEVGFYTPETSFAGGSWVCLKGKREVKGEFAPAGERMKNVWCRPAVVLISGKGFRMRCALAGQSIALQDYRASKSKQRKGCWRVVTANHEPLRTALTLDFSEAAAK